MREYLCVAEFHISCGYSVEFTVGASTLEQAQAEAEIYAAESGLDRELGYEGVYVLEEIIEV
jgi:predicted metallopeptidase